MSIDSTNDFRLGDLKVTVLRKILARLKVVGLGNGHPEPYRPGDTFTVVERKILQQLEP